MPAVARREEWRLSAAAWAADAGEGAPPQRAGVHAEGTAECRIPPSTAPDRPDIFKGWWRRAERIARALTLVSPHCSEAASSVPVRFSESTEMSTVATASHARPPLRESSDSSSPSSSSSASSSKRCRCEKSCQRHRRARTQRPLRRAGTQRPV